MKTLTTLLILISFAAIGQEKALSINRVFNLSPVQTTTESLIALQFGLNYPETDSIPYAIIYRVLSPDDSKEWFDSFAKRYGGYHNAKGRRVDIRFVINGKNKDFTFKEFRKILWP